MTPNRTYSRTMTDMAVAVAVALCPVAVFAQSSNPWNPYPVQKNQPVPQPVAPQPKYYQDPAINNPAGQPTATAPSRFAPADLAQRLSMPPRPPQNAAPYGYPSPAFNPYSNPLAYSGQPQGYANGYPQGNFMNPPPNLGGYGGYGPPIIGNNSWGAGPGNNSFPFGF